MKKLNTYYLVFLCAISIAFTCWRIKFLRANYFNEKACEALYVSVGLDNIDNALLIDNNPLFWANKGILYSRIDSIFIESFIEDKRQEYRYLDSSMICFKNAIELSNNEWSFKMNYALSLWMLGYDRQKAISVLHNAIKKHYVGCELFGILGMMEEKTGNTEEAFHLFTKMLIDKPSIVGSPFFYDLKKRDRMMTENIVDSAIHYYSERIYDNPIAMTRLGILLYEKESYQDSEELLTSAVSLMPTLNRAWYYLGLLAEKNNQSQKSRDMYYKSMMLDRKDILPLKKMALFEPEYESYVEILSYYGKEELAITLSNRFFAASMTDPYVICGLIKYFTPIN